MRRIPADADAILLPLGQWRQRAFGRLKVPRPDAEQRIGDHVADPATPDLQAAAFRRVVVVGVRCDRAHLLPIVVARRGHQDDRDQRGRGKTPPERNHRKPEHDEHGDDRQRDEAASGTGPDAPQRQDDEARRREQADARPPTGVRKVERERHRRDRERREVVGVVVIEMPQPPRVAGAEIEPGDDHAGIDDGSDQIDKGQPLDVAAVTDARGHDKRHERGLEEVVEDEVEAVALAQRAWHREHHPADQPAGQLERRARDGVRPPLLAIVDEVQHDRQQSGHGGQMDGLERAEQLVDAADSGQDVAGDADQQRVPSHRVAIDGVAGQHHDARKPSRRAGVRSKAPVPAFSPSSLEATAEATVLAPAGVRWKKS